MSHGTPRSAGDPGSFEDDETTAGESDTAESSALPHHPDAADLAALVHAWPSVPLDDALRAELPPLTQDGARACRGRRRAERWVRSVGRRHLPASLFEPLDREREEWEDFDEMVTEMCFEMLGLGVLVAAALDGWPFPMLSAALGAGVGPQEVRMALAEPGADTASVTAALEALAALRR